MSEAVVWVTTIVESIYTKTVSSPGVDVTVVVSVMVTFETVDEVIKS